MKKRKVGFLFNIITICLAVVAIAVGVYSLQKSSLNISGSLGFTAHNVSARIDAYMYGYATVAGGTPLTQSEKVRLTDANGLLIHDQATSYSLNLGATNGSGSATRYFSNLGASGKMEDIVVEITVSNTSGGTSNPKNILANVDFANCIPSSALAGKIRIDCDRSAAVLETTNGKTQATFTFKISLLPDSNGSYGDSTLTTPSNNVNLKMNLEETTTYTQSQVKTDAIAIKKFTTAEISSIKTGLKITTNDSYADLYPYYVEMGHVGNKYVKWLVVGTRGASDTDAVTALGDADKTALSKGLLLNKNYVMLSEKVLYSESPANYGISFQNEYTDGDPALNDYGYSGNDYATSNIRAFLNGKTVQKESYTDETGKYFADGEFVNLLTTYNLESDPLYAKIQGRTLTSLYADNDESMLNMWTSSYSGTEENLKPTSKDKLWLLSLPELIKIFTTTKNMMKTTCEGGNTASWWSRTAKKGTNNEAQYINSQGFPNYYRIVSEFDDGVRPAFQI